MNYDPKPGWSVLHQYTFVREYEDAYELTIVLSEHVSLEDELFLINQGWSRYGHSWSFLKPLGIK